MTIQHLPNTPEPLRSFLLSDRQWPRKLRIAHAEMQSAASATPEDKKFWRGVIDANTVGGGQ